MTNDEKRKFISQAQTELAEAADARAKEFMRMAIGARGMSYLVLIAPGDQLDRLYADAVKIKALLVGEQLNGVLKDLGIAATVPAADQKCPVNGWEMP